MRGLVSAVGASVGLVEPVASLDGVFFQEVHALGVGRLLGGGAPEHALVADPLKQRVLAWSVVEAREEGDDVL